MLLGGLFLTGLGAYLHRSVRDFLRQFVHGLGWSLALFERCSEGTVDDMLLCKRSVLDGLSRG